MSVPNLVRPEVWWFKLAKKILPSRCRVIPEATNPSQPLLRQLEIVKGRVYLQQFASAEHPVYYHTHPWAKGTIAIGLSGWLREEEPASPDQQRYWVAPYARVMSAGHIHTTLAVSPSHTSIFIGLGKKTEEKYYWRKEEKDGQVTLVRHAHYKDHIKAFVASGHEGQMTREEFEKTRK